MKRLLSLVLCAVFAAVPLSGCVSLSLLPGGRGVAGRGTPEIFEFPVGEITEVRMELACNVEFYSAPSDTVTLQIQPNLMEHVTVSESGGVLTVRSRRNIRVSSSTNIPVLTVSTPALTRFDFSGAGAFTANDVISSDTFTLTVSGAGTGSAKLDVTTLEVVMTGAGDFRFSGRADAARLMMTGAGKLDALDLEAREGNINLSGVGTVKLHCTEALKITAGGVGTVEYKGSPSVDLSSGGLVTIKKID
jgi:hypothetical protein